MASHISAVARSRCPGFRARLEGTRARRRRWSTRCGDSRRGLAPGRSAVAVIGAVGRRVAEGGAALASNLRRPNLRRAQLAFGSAYASEWSLTVALGVVAFRDGGATAVGIVALIRMLPSALIAPFATAVADRVRRDRVLIWIGVIRGAAVGAAALVLALDLSVLFVYLLAVIATIPFTAFRPAHSALLPALCETPTELTAANASRGLLDSASILVGPLLAALLLDISGPEAVFVLIVG